ncbi:MAG: polymer-forming cytoskeletal protein [Desulfobacteraceae bacterium]|nr:polymer-forming cytoskeletal protein [Desulfobacteraceae bacterium]
MKKNKEQINSFLGKDTEFEGKLSFTGAVRIDGVFEGEIFTKGTLIVGEKAIIKSDIHTSRIIISGEVHGNIVAENSIRIQAPGKVFGNIQSPILTIDEGVIFEGSCQMQKQSEALEKKVSVLPK